MRALRFVANGSSPEISKNDQGVFDDVAVFHASGKGLNKLNRPVKLGFGLFARNANRRIETLRNRA